MNHFKEYIEIPCREYKEGTITDLNIPVSSEYSLLMKINGNPYVRIATSGGDLNELAAGHLFTEGIITSYKDIADITIDPDEFSVNITTIRDDSIFEKLFRLKTIASGCGSGFEEIESNPEQLDPPSVINPSTITSSMIDFLGSSELHGLTHGVHTAALYSINGTKLKVFEEIGRHNAVDKVTGWGLTSNVDFSDTMILTTGRLSSEMLKKALSARIPLILSRSAPTTLSVELAKQMNAVMITGIRKNSFYIFNKNVEVKV